MTRHTRTPTAPHAEPESAKVRITTGLIAALICVCCALPVNADSIRLHDDIGVSSEKVTLKQVAELTGDDATALGDTVVGEFENDAKRLTITLDQVRDALKDQGINWGLMSLRGYRRCHVKRTGEIDEPARSNDRAVAANIEQRVDRGTSATLRDEVEQVIHKMADTPLEDLRITFRDHDRKRLQRSALESRFEIAPSATSAIGRLPLTVRRYEAGRAVETFTVTADVQKRAKAVITKKPLSRGDRFTKRAVNVKEVWLTDDRTPIADVSLVVDQQAGGALDSGSLVYPDDLRSPELVKRGELVTVRCINGALVVRTVARARGDGAMGETIKLRNESSHETFHARVTGRRKASVQLGANPESPMAARQGANR